MRLRASLVIVSILLAGPALADPVDDLIARQMERQRLPGLSLAVVRDGKVIKAQGYGLANLELEVPVRPETRFQSGSMGKQFTATAVMLLVEAGKLKLDDPVRRWLPGAPEAWKDITVRHLLTHTAGVPGFDYGGTFDLRKDYTEEQLLDAAFKLPLDFPPGSQWRYSNTGYVVLGILIHKVSGKFYGDFLAERVFQPLGMTSTRIIDEADIVPNRASGYRLVRGAFKNQTWVSPTLNTTADGALYVTTIDLARWDAALYGEKVLRKASLDEMWTPARLSDGKTVPYGFGWALRTTRGHRSVEHGGAWQGFVSYIVRFLDDKLTVIVLVNSANAAPGRLAYAVAATYLPDLAPPRPAAVKVAPAVLKSYAGLYDWGSAVSVTPDDGGLVVGLDRMPLHLVPASETTFFDDDNPDTTITFPRPPAALVVKAGAEGEEHRVARIGPLPRELAPRPDAEREVGAALDAIVAGGKTLAASAAVAPRLKKLVASGFAEGAGPRAFLGSQSVAGIERHGEKIARVVYYRLEDGRALLAYVTGGGSIADVDLVE